MRLADFLTKAVTSGHTKFRLASEARGTEIARGALNETLTADYLEDLAKGDAAHLPRESMHAYTIVAEDGDGAKLTRFSLRVPGGQGASDDVHRVDAASTNTAGAALGHMVRLNIEQGKVILGMFNKTLDRAIAAEHENGRLTRTLSKRGTVELESRIVDAELEREKLDRQTVSERWDKALQMAQPIVARLLPGGTASALASLRSSLSDRQLEQLSDVLGPVRFGKLLSLDSAEKVGALLIEETARAEVDQLMAILTPEQQALVGAALTKEMRRRDHAEKEKAKADPPPTSGAPS